MAQAQASYGDPDGHPPGSPHEVPATASVEARVSASSASISWVNHRLSRAWEVWHDVTCILLNLVQVWVSIPAWSFVVRTFYKVRLHMATVIQVMITRILMPLASLLTVVALRSLSWTGCRQIAHSTASCDLSRMVWNLNGVLRRSLVKTRMIVISWKNIKVNLKDMIQFLFMFNFFRTLIQALTWSVFFKFENQNEAIHQTSLLVCLDQELRDTIFAKLPMRDVIRLQAVCRDFVKVMTNDTFKATRKISEGSFGPSVFYLETNVNYTTWQWMSYDLLCQQWKKMPSFSSLPPPNIELFKDFFVAQGGGLFCIDVGKGTNEELIVYHPLAKEQKTLPHLIHRRRPVLIHILVDEISNTYKIIVAGSSTIGIKNLSRKTEVYDSCTKCWNESGDIPGPEFALNDYQTGVYVKELKILFCIGFLPKDEGHGILAYSVEKGVWIKNLLCQLPQDFLYNSNRIPSQITIAQLLEYNNEVFLFSEQESGQEVIHSIHKIQDLDLFGALDDDGNYLNKDKITWKRVICESRNGTRGLLVYPEFECLAYGKDKFCIFNTIEHTGALYNIYYINNAYTFIKEKIPMFPRLKGNSLTFHTFNPQGFIFYPNFKISL